MAFTEDLTVFLDLGDFADVAVFTSQETPAAYEPKTVNGIFDAPFIDGKAADMNLETSGPQVMLRESDVTGVVRGDYCQIKGRTWDVVQIRPDGTGMAVVMLSET